MNKEEIQANPKFAEDFQRLIESWNNAQRICPPDEFAVGQRRLLNDLCVYVINFMQINFELIKPENPQQLEEAKEEVQEQLSQ